MRIRFATIYAIFCTLLLVVGFGVVFYYAWQAGISQTVACVCGLALSFSFAPLLHEFGHLVAGKSVGFALVYFKAFCFKIAEKEGKKAFSLAVPFAPDQTQMLPKFAGNMQKRALWYTLGGLLFSGVASLLLVTMAILAENFVAWGIFPYTAYVFLLNIFPVEYASGKTDILVAVGLKRGYDGEKCMLSAMEIQGRLYEGKAFQEIDEGLYFDLPQLCEDEPLYAVLLDLRYRYYLDGEDYAGAADCLNRLALAQAYLSDEETQRVAAELTYMHALSGDLQAAEESGRLCREYLKGNTVTAKRILAAYSLASGKIEAIALLKAQAEAVKDKERILGVRKLEEKLLGRIKTEENEDN